MDVANPEAGLAHDVEGTGTPVVLLHGMTFDRRTWRPVVDELDGSVTSIAVDLPGHGGSSGRPTRLEEVVEQVHRLLESLAVERPVVVGHSMGAAVAALYAGTHPARGLAMVDQATEIEPFARALHRIAPMLRGPAFGQAWAAIENGLGLDRIPEPVRTLVRDAHTVEQDVVLGYWDQLLTTDPAGMQAWIDARAAGIRAPCLAVFGRQATEGERERVGRMPDAQLEEWVGDGHFVHLVDPARFATRLRAFVDHCDHDSDQRGDQGGAVAGEPVAGQRS
ncbi:alpha/beta hydrolase [Pseudonocardia sp. C8]|uniref:alpha/beta fold hydrolase n=1 Tax=Pseudonocardia sp. C8 TaxID=2762759 RepID=UPI0016426F99|nr:alpha/beta hydrolase [Pseudonocardia sp. C8]MBC3192298.1 alpha/beta hydrolase [Pseudonocardia sp. C8]